MVKVLERLKVIDSYLSEVRVRTRPFDSFLNNLFRDEKGKLLEDAIKLGLMLAFNKRSV